MFDKLELRRQKNRLSAERSRLKKDELIATLSATIAFYSSRAENPLGCDQSAASLSASESLWSCGLDGVMQPSLTEHFGCMTNGETNGFQGGLGGLECTTDDSSAKRLRRAQRVRILKQKREEKKRKRQVLLQPLLPPAAANASSSSSSSSNSSWIYQPNHPQHLSLQQQPHRTGGDLSAAVSGLSGAILSAQDAGMYHHLLPPNKKSRRRYSDSDESLNGSESSYHLYDDCASVKTEGHVAIKSESFSASSYLEANADADASLDVREVRMMKNRRSAERSRKRKDDLIEELTFQLFEKFVDWLDQRDGMSSTSSVDDSCNSSVVTSAQTCPSPLYDSLSNDSDSLSDESNYDGGDDASWVAFLGVA